jgi:hypothetical protein
LAKQGSDHFKLGDASQKRYYDQIFILLNLDTEKAQDELKSINEKKTRFSQFRHFRSLSNLNRVTFSCNPTIQKLATFKEY